MEICQKISTLRIPPFKVIGTDTDQSATYDFLLVFHSNHGSVSYRFQDKWWFWLKSQIFSTPVYLTPPVSEMTNTVSRGTLNCSIPYLTPPAEGVPRGIL